MPVTCSREVKTLETFYGVGQADRGARQSRPGAGTSFAALYSAALDGTRRCPAAGPLLEDVPARGAFPCPAPAIVPGNRFCSTVHSAPGNDVLREGALKRYEGVPVYWLP